MQDSYSLEALCRPYYSQLETVDILRTDSNLPFNLVLPLLKRFRRELLYELKYFFRVERKFTRYEYKLRKIEVQRDYVRLRRELRAKRKPKPTPELPETSIVPGAVPAHAEQSSVPAKSNTA